MNLNLNHRNRAVASQARPPASSGDSGLASPQISSDVAPLDAVDSRQPPPPGNSWNLISAVLSSPQLKQQLASMPPDKKTVVLSSDDSLTPLAHPAWKQLPPRHFESDSNKLLLDSGSPSSGSPSSVSPTSGSADSPRSDEQETIELALPRVAMTESARQRVECPDTGFVPRRRVAMLGDGKHCEADYRLVGQLGAGGTGIVYQAHQRAIDREVAIKVLRESLAVDPACRERFLTEARVIGGLDHPNVIALHEVCVDQQGVLFYSMKRIDGTSWDHQIKEKSTSQNVQVLLRVADAIRYAHSRGLIHRDIKPENVMLGRFGEVLLADWGLAISHQPEEAIKQDTTIGGTPAYMAPELAAGDNQQVSFATDVYLLGATLFQIVTGYPPHHGETLLECIQSAAENKIRPTNFKGELLDIALKAMATDPADRYESVEAMVDALNQQREHEESSRLVKRVQGHLKNATVENHYEGFRIADALLREALEIWPENRRGQELQIELNLEFARAATDQGDLDLALSLYEAAGFAESEAAARVKQLRDLRNQNMERESRYSTLFTHSPEAGLLVRMSSGRVVEANQMFSDLMGYAEDEVVGKLMHELNVWVCPKRRELLLKELEKKKRIDNFEAEFQHRSGRRIDVLISGRVTKVHGEVMLISTIRDISLRKKAENELRHSRRRLRDLQALAGLATWAYDVESQQVTWSEEAFRMAGRATQQGPPSPRQYLRTIHVEDRALIRSTLEAAIESGAAYEIKVRQRGANGKFRPLVIRGQPIFDESGKTVEVYGVFIPQKVS